MKDIDFCIDYLKQVNYIKKDVLLPPIELFRALMNITMPFHLSDIYYERQNKVLQELLCQKKIVDISDLTPLKPNIYLYQGDITLIRCDAIVNACNSKLLGCFQPLHSCIDNAIHSYAGLQVRRDLLKIMQEQGYDEPNGRAKITKAHNLPSQYILHTVGPIIKQNPSKEDEQDLYHCYYSCLTLASAYHLNSVAFCSISTGLYGYPIEQAAKIALKAVSDYIKQDQSIKIIFDVFSKEDYDVYYKTIETMS
ncbi:MAG: protein-ADP-ribose hydrolase [Prevotella sp.]|nr:protein-ADP-ribose hydrolase [Staphylococcus sp.]MCM1350834.1 protein-ADP-ribose hydrolase [Prevotella sp.]